MLKLYEPVTNISHLIFQASFWLSAGPIHR